MSVNKSLTKRQKKLLLFVNEYVQDFNGTKAVIAAGYSAKGAAQAASRLLKRVDVKAMIAQRTKGAIAKIEEAAETAITRNAVTAEKIIDALADMGLAHQVVAKFLKVSSGGDLYHDFTGATKEELQAIQPMLQELTTESYAEGRGDNKREVIRTKIKFVERRGVLELLGKWNKLGIWTGEPAASVIFTHELSLQELEIYAQTGVLPERAKGKLPQAQQQRVM